MLTALLIKNIKCLVQTEEKAALKVCGAGMSSIGSVNNAYLIIRDGLIADFGSMEDPKYKSIYTDTPEITVIDATGRFVFPSFCDSHTHLVYSGSREQEYKEKIRGLSYTEIALRGGGILNTVRKVRETSEDELYRQSMPRIDEIISSGTGAIEIKSGYGLTPEDELKMLRVIKRIKESTQLEVRATFLGAHAVPDEFKKNPTKYVDLVINKMIPLVASEKLADFIDVFCDEGFFTPEETERILVAGIGHGLVPKLHANELGFSGGIQSGVKYHAMSVDHLEYTGDDEIKCLLDSDTMPTLLPGSSFFLGLPEPPARKMIDSGLPVALASDYNPGSSPSGNMKFIMSLGCIRLKMLPEEVVNAVTINSACAMGISGTHGSIARGKVANLFITTEIPSLEFMPYAYGTNLIDTIILRGNVINKK